MSLVGTDRRFVAAQQIVCCWGLSVRAWHSSVSFPLDPVTGAVDQEHVVAEPQHA
jgi:hypothetical protein